MLINLDMSIVNLALPTIGESLHVKLSMLQWIVVAYLITASVAFILGGRLADRYGAKRISCLGMLAFLLGSLLSGFSIDGWLIAFGRAVQGVGFGLMVPAMIAIACSQFDPDKKAYAVSLIIVTAGITQCIGPTVGGIIIHWLSWRWIFFINVPICILYTCTILSLYKDVVLEKTHEKLGYGGLTFYFGFSLLLIYATEVLEIQPVDWLPFIGAVIFSTLFLIISYRVESKKKTATVPYRLLRNKRYRGIMLIRSVSQVSFFAYLFFMPFWYSGIFHLSAFDSGLNLLYLSAGFGVVALFSAQITRRIGFHRNIWIAACLVFASTLIILFLVDDKNILWSNIGITLAGISVAFVITPTVTLALESVAPETLGQATGLFYSASVGVAVPLNVAITGLIMSTCLSTSIMSALTATGVHLNPAQLYILPKAIGGSMHMSLLEKSFSPHLLTAISSGYRHAMHTAFSLIAAFCTLSAIVGLIVLHKLPDAESTDH